MTTRRLLPLSSFSPLICATFAHFCLLSPTFCYFFAFCTHLHIDKKKGLRAREPVFFFSPGSRFLDKTVSYNKKILFINVIFSAATFLFFSRCHFFVFFPAAAFLFHLYRFRFGLIHLVVWTWSKRFSQPHKSRQKPMATQSCSRSVSTIFIYVYIYLFLVYLCYPDHCIFCL